ncbi:MAG: hypothetical protein KJ666_04270 [Bacteroidetes bacterium]|nr:hypothetical protein [Bacteroidota bacterium]MBU2491075.1 hypothetical protein [Bacteroidota bacterium]MBU2584236.1 hypothetical protein [Bacteroidota bacterium]
MKGIQYLVDEEGKKNAVLIDLNKWKNEWVDFYDILVSKHRRKEKRVSWKELKKELQNPSDEN